MRRLISEGAKSVGTATPLWPGGQQIARELQIQLSQGSTFLPPVQADRKGVDGGAAVLWSVCEDALDYWC